MLGSTQESVVAEQAVLLQLPRARSCCSLYVRCDGCFWGVFVMTTVTDPHCSCGPRPEMPSVYFYEVKQPPELRKVAVALQSKTLETVSALVRVLVACTNSLVAISYMFLLG